MTMPAYNPQLVESVVASIERARRLHDEVASCDGVHMMVDKAELAAILEAHFLLCGYVMGSESMRKPAATDKP